MTHYSNVLNDGPTSGDVYDANVIALARADAQYQDDKENFKADYFSIGGSDKMVFDGVKYSMRDIAGLSVVELNAIVAAASTN